MIHSAMYLDFCTYLPDDILTKADRASVAVSLETSAPLLDYRVAGFAWKIPFSMHIADGGGKYILRRILEQYVPKQLIDRPKMGFRVPVHLWIRGPLRDWAEELLNEKRLYEEGFFDPKPIRNRWEEHLVGTHNWGDYLWDVLMFQAWLEVQ